MGLGLDEFSAAIGGMKAIHRKMAALYQIGQFEPHGLNMPADAQELSFSNRYVTLPKFAGREPALPFGRAVDPVNVLSSMMQSVGVHLDDNRVLYYEWFEDPQLVASNSTLALHTDLNF